VADATKAEFLRLLRSNEDLQREKSEIEQQRERAEEEVDQLRREIAQQSQALQLKLDQDALEAGDPLRRRERRHRPGRSARSCSRSRHTPGLAVSAVEQRLMELVMNVVTVERQAADEARKRALKDREVDNLQRRIKKLNDSLVHDRAAAAAGRGDEVASTAASRRSTARCRALDLGDQQAGKKKELMAEIFKANLKLQKKPGGA
jgi:hypothetical protein